MKREKNCLSTFLFSCLDGSMGLTGKASDRELLNLQSCHEYKVPPIQRTLTSILRIQIPLLLTTYPAGIMIFNRYLIYLFKEIVISEKEKCWKKLRLVSQESQNNWKIGGERDHQHPHLFNELVLCDA